jgi:hypothetical protein
MKMSGIWRLGKLQRNYKKSQRMFFETTFLVLGFKTSGIKSSSGYFLNQKTAKLGFLRDVHPCIFSCLGLYSYFSVKGCMYKVSCKTKFVIKL